jgi:hypothetical protein
MISLQDKNDLLAFFAALTDPRVAGELPPFDRPRLWSESNRVPTTFGVGTSGSGGFTPASVAVLPGYAGNPHYTLGVDRALAGALHFLCWDVAANATPTVLLGQNVYLAMTPSLVFVGMPQLTQGAGAGGGVGTFTFAIPAGPGLAGATFYGQWLLFDPQGPNGMTVSDAFALPLF